MFVPSTDEELTAQLRHIEAQQRALDDERVGVLQQWDARQSWADDGSASAAARLARETAVSGQVARERVKVARKLRAMPFVSAAIEELGWSKVRLLVHTCTPRTMAAFAEHEEVLVEQARRLSADQLATLLLHWRRLVDPDGANADADSMHEGQFVQLDTSFGGEGFLKGRLDPESTAIVRSVLDAIADELFRSEQHSNAEAMLRGNPVPPLHGRAERAADALVEMARRAAATTSAEAAGATVTPARPVVLVTIDVEAEVDVDGEARRLLTARLADGSPLPMDDAVRLACDAAVARVLTKGGTVPLELGRTTRDPSEAQRRALSAIWSTCAYPGCDRPFAWCQLHHVWHWEDGGPTDVDWLLPLCTHHHRVHHKGRYRIRRRLDGTFVFERPFGTLIGEANPTMSQLYGAARRLFAAA